MAHGNTSNLRAEILWFVGVFGIVVGVLLSLAPGGAAAQGEDNSNANLSVLDAAPPTVRRQILKAATGGFQPSLEMKENVEFLLTPALLVQQVVSEDVVITYPSE